MKRNRKKALIGAAIIGIIVTIVAAVGSTYAYYTSQDEVTNNFDIGDVDIVVDEEFIPTVGTKVVQIKNTTENECLVRVSITPRWVEENKNPWAGDVSDNTIELIFSEHLKNAITNDFWYKDTDGYYYYMAKLPAGQSTPILLESVKIKEGITLPDSYKGKELIVDVKAEAVQATKINNEYQFEKNWLNLSTQMINSLKSIVGNKGSVKFHMKK